MEIHVLQYEDRTPEDFGEHWDVINHLLTKNKKTCTEHTGYTYEFLTTTEYVLPPYWLKVALVMGKLSTIPDGDYILWLDSDAVIDKPDKLLELISKPMCISTNYNNPGFNAGVWFVRTCEVGRAIMNTWFEAYPSDMWEESEDGEFNGWNCLDPVWAGEAYEEGAFRVYVHPKYEEHIQLPHWSVINQPYGCVNEDTLVYHFARFQRFGWRRHNKNIWRYVYRDTGEHPEWLD